MKNLFVVVLTCSALVLPGCKGKKAEEGAGGARGALRIALLVNGNLGDKSFNDSAANGLAMIRDQLGCKIHVVEVGSDASKLEPALLDLCDEKYDILICGTWQMQEIVQKAALDYPDQKFIVYDTSVDYANDPGGAYKNIYSIEYLENEGSYLAGVLAAKMSEGGVIGFVGGMDNTGIRDFLVGYIQGAESARPGIRVIPSFVGNFYDAAKAKELAFSQYRMGVDVIFSSAGDAGLGTLEAAKERGRYVIGVDSDQAALYEASDPVLARLIISSMLKRVDMSIFLAVRQAVEGTLPWGTLAVLGINEGCIALADNEIYQDDVPASVRDLIADDTKKIQSGEIKVASAFGMDEAEYNRIVNSARP
jgi:basic membrane protein A